MKKNIYKKVVDISIKNYEPNLFDGQIAYEKFMRSRGMSTVKKTNNHQYFKLILSLVSVFGAIFFFVFMPKDKYVEVSSEEEIIRYELPDSSQLILYPHSSTTYNEAVYSKSKRDITVEYGKVYFEVKKDNNSPFAAKCDYGDIKVIGTAFQVEKNDTAIYVHVDRGRVHFLDNNNNKAIMLSKGMNGQLVVGQSSPQVIKPLLPNPSAWATGMFHYYNTPINVVVHELSKYYKVNIISSDNNKKLTADFKNDDLNEILEIIESALNIKFQVSE